jgi:gluconokinase
MSNVLDDIVDGVEPWSGVVSIMTSERTPVLLALDIGTSGIRAALFDERAREIAGTRISNDHGSTTADLANFDAEVLLERVADTLSAVLENVPETVTSIEHIAISCFWHSLMGIDEQGHPTTPVLGWADSRAAAATLQLRAQFDEAAIHDRTGCRFHPSYWPAKLRWLRDEQPEVLNATKRWLSFADYLAYQFFDETVTSVSMASGTGLLNQSTCEWDIELLKALGITAAQLPEIITPDRPLPKLTSTCGELWPQLRGALLFPAVGDGAANGIGSGCNSTERVSLMIGTSGAMRVSFKGEPPARIPPALWCYRANRERIVIGGALSDGGGLYNWIKETLLFDRFPDELESELELLAPDGHGLTILPFWNGERSTGWNPNARGTVLGLSTQTRGVEILRAAMEAVAYRFALIADELKPFAPNALLVASGNALRSSPTWVQILADVIGRPVALTEASEASLRGAALLALEAAGKIQSVEELSVPVEKVFEPDLTHQVRYRNALDRQERIYKQLLT